MKFKEGEYIRLNDGRILQAIYADEEQVLFLYITQNRVTGNYCYCGCTNIISNKDVDYTLDGGFEKIAPVCVSEQTQWEPLVKGYRYSC